MSDDWKRWPKVCKPRSGFANTKRYRWVRIWQPPRDASHLESGTQGWCCLGRFGYMGPLRSSIMSWKYQWSGGRVVHSDEAERRLRAYLTR